MQLRRIVGRKQFSRRINTNNVISKYMRIRPYFIFFLAVVVTCIVMMSGVSYGQEDDSALEEVDGVFSNTGVCIGDTVEFTVTVRYHDPKQTIRLIAPDPTFSNLVVVNTAVSTENSYEGGLLMKEKRYIFTLKPRLVGPASVQSFACMYYRKTDDNETLYRQILPARNIRVRKKSHILFVSIIVCVLSVSAITFRVGIHHMRRKKRSHVISLEEMSIYALEELRPLLDEKDVNVFIQRLYAIASEYMQKKFTISADVFTHDSEKIVPCLPASIDGNIGRVLEKLAKYVKEIHYTDITFKQHEVRFLYQDFLSFVKKMQ